MISLKRKSKSHLICGSLLVIVGILIFIFPIIYNKYQEKQEEIKLEYFFEVSTIDNYNVIKDTKQEDYIAVLEIPSINLKKGLYAIDSKNNNVNKNIEIIDSSDMPDITKGNFILAGHSGTGRIAFFDDLDKLIVDDTIIVYYKNIKYIYQINNIESIVKDGTIEIKREFEGMITLTTCNQKNKNEQLVITGILISKENY